MNYFLSNLFHDWKWWAKIGFAFIGAMNVMDILSATFAYPGYFGLWIVRGTVISGFSGLIAYYIYQNRHDKKNRQLDALLPPLAAERRAYFEKMIADDPKFQTFCYECLYYDNGRRCCSLRLHGREVKIKLNSLDTYSYCLYWNLSEHPILALTDRTFGEKTGDQKV
ncbi:MAG: hypothetical protein NTW95_10605 [Candidatus Aminicenantes bacterium]|nr:hypothetical protein [Candidatus Aminicenantes bacterium]